MDVLLFGGFHLEKKTLWLAVGGNVGIPLEVVTITAPLTLIIWSRAQHLVITSYTRTHTNILTSTCTVDRQHSDSRGQRRSYVGLWLSSAWTKEKQTPYFSFSPSKLDIWGLHCPASDHSEDGAKCSTSSPDLCTLLTAARCCRTQRVRCPA